MQFVSMAQKLDYALAAICLVFMLYFVFTHSYVMAGLFGASAALSFVMAKLNPSRWLVKRMLLAKLKS